LTWLSSSIDTTKRRYNVDDRCNLVSWSRSQSHSIAERDTEQQQKYGLYFIPRAAFGLARVIKNISL